MSANYSVEKFIGIFTEKYGDNIYRKIDVFRDKNGKKQTKCAHSQWTCEQISENQGTGNTFDLYLKHMNDVDGQLTCVDFDNKRYTHHPLYDRLRSAGAIETKSMKGGHLYIAIKNLPEYSNAVNVAIDDKHYQEIDLISRSTNMWETPNGGHWEFCRGSEIPSFDWDDIKIYFNVPKMNIKSEKKVKPLVSSISSNSISENLKRITKCSDIQFQSYLDRLKNRYGYDDFIKVGAICHTNFEGNSQGFGVWLQWVNKDTTEHDSDRGHVALASKYEGFSDYTGQVADWRALKKMADTDTPTNPYEELYNDGGTDAIIYELNTGEKFGTKIGYNQMTSEFIIQTPAGWHLKSDRQAIIHFENYNFTIEVEEVVKVLSPLKIWRQAVNRNTYTEIVYDPSNQETGAFNIWRGYPITKDIAEKYDVSLAQPILDHLFTIWADGSQERYEYMLNWFAHKLQRPYKKMAVTICLNSGEGAGKNVILNHFEQIMGCNYDSVSSAKSILGDFNAVLEGKTLLNFDEVTYGGNHEKNNQMKALISEDFVHINKKNKEAYRIRSMADFIITTNEDYFIGVTGDSRRYCPMALNRRWEGVQTDESYEYFKKIMDAPPEAFANFLYNRDISEFNPRKFSKTTLFQQQVEKSYTSTIRWLYETLESGHISSQLGNRILKWDTEIVNEEDETAHANKMYETYGSTHTDDYMKLKFQHKGVNYMRMSKLYEVYSRARMGCYSKTQTDQVFKQTLADVFGKEYKIKSHPQLGVCAELPNLQRARELFNVWAKWDYKWGKIGGDFEDLDEVTFDNDW